MEGMFSRRAGQLVLCFTPNEIDDASVFMQLFSEEERKKGRHVPDLGEDFFKDLASGIEGNSIVFDMKYLGFAIGFIEEFLEQAEGYDDALVKMGDFLEEVKEWDPSRHMLQ